ncbi:MAG TPA: MFS transporter [Candidatus Angelobacter sp.]|jgi:MFS family permease|nr:MFS transporter [Candidatus Angelobacter sp.]
MASPPPRRAFRALQHRDFRLLGSATLISIIGTQMQNVGIDWHIYVLTRSPLALGSLGLVRVLPIIFFSMWGGVVADRHDRKWVQFTTQGVMAIIALLLGLATFFGRDRVWLVYVLTALTAAANAFDAPARQALVPRLVPIEDLQGALTMNLTFMHVAMITGPSLAGLIIASSGGAGTHSTRVLGSIYFANSASFLAVMLALALLRASGRPEPTAGAQREGWLASLKIGFRFMLSAKVILWTMVLDFFATLFSGAISLLPVVADQILHVGAQGYGWLRSATGAGALLASMVTAVYPLPRRQGPVLLWAVAAYGAATVVYGISHDFYLTLFALAATGAADLFSTVIRSTARQILTPDELRGRITAFNMVFFIGGPQLGEMEAGFTASLFGSAALGTMISITSGGAVTLLLVAFFAMFVPVMRNYELPASAPTLEKLAELKK